MGATAGYSVVGDLERLGVPVEVGRIPSLNLFKLVEVARTAEGVLVQVFGLGTVEARILSKVGLEVGAALVELLFLTAAVYVIVSVSPLGLVTVHSSSPSTRRFGAFIQLSGL